MESENSVLYRQSELPCLSFPVFEDMRKKQELCDFTITVQGYTLTAHRVIIAAVIPFFRLLFTSEEECTEEKEVTLGDMNPKALESLIDFAYSNSININDDNVHSLLVTSRFLQLQQVGDACSEYLSQRLENSNVVKVRNSALKINDSNLIASTTRYIMKNFEELSKSEDFLNLSFSCLKEIISKDSLNTPNEETVFEAIVKWIRCSPATRHSLLPELLSEVRMIYLSLDYLNDRILSNELIAESVLSLILVEQVKNYRMSSTQKASFLNLRTCPRKISGIYAVCYSYVSGVSVHYADFANNTWHQLASEMKYDIVYHVVAANEKIYLFLEETIHIFHPRRLEWEELDPKHQFVCGAAVSFHDDIIYCFGSVHHGFRQKIRFFDTQQKVWLKERIMEKGCCNSAAATLGSSIYVTGGCGRFFLGSKYPTSSSGCKTVKKYRTLTRVWSEVPSMRTPRERHGCIGMNGKLYVCGGYNAAKDHYLLSAETYDPLTGQWKFISEMEKEKSSVSLVLHSGKIFAFGSNNEEEPAIAEIYDPHAVKWEFGFSGPPGFRRAVSIADSSN